LINKISKHEYCYTSNVEKVEKLFTSKSIFSDKKVAFIAIQTQFIANQNINPHMVLYFNINISLYIDQLWFLSIISTERSSSWRLFLKHFTHVL